MKQFDSNDEDFDQAVPTSGRSTTTTAAAPAVAQPAPAPVGTEEEYSFDDEGINEAVKSVEGLPVVKISKSEIARIALVPGFKMKKNWIHYLEGSGSIICHSTPENPNAVCCHKLGQPKDRFTALVFRYVNVGKDGKFVAGATGPVVQVQAVRLSKANARDILDAADEGQSVYTIDLKMRHIEGAAFGYRFTRMSPKNAWRSIEAEALALAEQYKDGVKLSRVAGKRLNATELNATLASGSASAEKSQSMEKMLATMGDDE
jgi:hypothetical protein